MNKSRPVCSNVPYFCLNETIFAEQVLISEIAQCLYTIAIIKKTAIASLGIGKSNWLKDSMLGSRRNSQSPESGQ
jgi:hypothetical protein